MKIPEQFDETVLLLSDLLKNRRYAIRGAAGLVLQGLDMIAVDIDIICDEETALKANELLKDYLVEEVEFKESDKFRSYFGKFNINGTDVEVMGEWQIRDTKGNWSSPYNGSDGKEVDVNGGKVFVTTVPSELSMFAKMGRWNAYHKIRKQVSGLEDKSDQLEIF